MPATAARIVQARRDERDGTVSPPREPAAPRALPSLVDSGPGLGAQARRRIGDGLRDLYGDPSGEEVPEALLALLRAPGG